MVIQLYSEIGTGDCTAQAISEKLTQAAGERVDLRINSPGGLISDGIAIYNLIKQHGDVHAIIDGVCASIATVIMCGAKTVSMAKNAMLFIHQPLVVGPIEANADSLRKMADGLDMNEDAILKTYLGKVGGHADEAKLKEMMKSDTFINANAALDLGFIDSIIGGSDVKTVNRHAALLNMVIMADESSEQKNETPQTEPDEASRAKTLEHWKAKLEQLSKDFENQIQERMLKLEERIHAKNLEREAVAVAEAVAEMKPHMKAIKPDASADQTSKVGSIQRAKDFRAKMSKRDGLTK